jgi:23S rRNA (uridine2552-2'-O)-methyltransferase
MGSQWQNLKKRDPYYKRAKEENYRSRASYKLLQLNKKFKIIKENNKVLDLGASPGGWSQVALERIGEGGTVVGVDLNKIKPFPEENFHFIRGDFTEEKVQREISEKLEGEADAIICDASPSLSGIKQVDHLRSMDLVESVLTITDKLLKNKGNLLIKIFQGEEYKNILTRTKKNFKTLKTTKPASSRKKSSEMYLIGLGHKKLR